MRSPIISSISYGVAGGGTIDGDLTISGDLTVSGSATNTFDETVTGQVIAGTTLGSVSVPSLALGDGNTGFYEETDNRLCVSIAGGKKLEFGEAGDYITFGGNSGYPSIDTSAIPSATNPGFLPHRSDTTDGVGGIVGTVALITNS